MGQTRDFIIKINTSWTRMSIKGDQSKFGIKKETEMSFFPQQLDTLLLMLKQIWQQKYTLHIINNQQAIACAIFTTAAFMNNPLVHFYGFLYSCDNSSPGKNLWYIVTLHQISCMKNPDSLINMIAKKHQTPDVHTGITHYVDLMCLWNNSSVHAHWSQDNPESSFQYKTVTEDQISADTPV